MLSVGSMFSGAGLLDYGLHLAGLHHEWLCEFDPWRRGILRQRFPDARVYDDVRHVGAHCGRVDVVAGGFPCKGASSAGPQNGFDHPETALWREMRRAIGELEPRYVLIENVANLLALHDGAVWGEVLADLAALGRDVRWDCLPAASVGAPHLRDRVFAVATYADGADEGRHAGVGRVADWRPDARGGRETAADPERERGAGRRTSLDVPGAAGEAQGEARQRERRWDAADDRGATATDADGTRADAHAAPSGSRPAVGERDRATAHHEGDGQPPRGGDGLRVEQASVAGQAACATGADIDWGQYADAIERWEAVHGPAPQPLVRRVDDRSANRVVRSRLSALGDGVQVQVGYHVGRYIADLERERLKMTPTDRLSA